MSEAVSKATPQGGAIPGRGLALADLIVAFKRALSPAVCQEIIAKFEQDPRRHESLTQIGLAPELRRGTQVEMASQPEWAALKKIVSDKATECLQAYARRYPAIEFVLKSVPVVLSSPIVERVDPGQGFDWHIDSGPAGSENRFLSALMYLNDMNEGGTTDFPLQGLALQPSQGTIVMFPPFWMYPHRGSPPARSVKYKMTAYFMIDRGSG